MDFKFAEVVYGVIKTHNGFTICTEVSVKKLQYDTKERLYWRTCTGITYKKLDFAMKKADDFVKRCNKNFVNFEGKQIIFKFINVGLFADSTGENNGQTDESAEKVKKIIESHYFVNQPVQA